MINIKKEYERSNLWVVLLMAVFCLVYIRSLTFVYIDGDDATSIAYHVMGRNRAIQPAYAPYHGMMDKVLSVLPPQEPNLRVISLLITNLASVCMVILMLTLVFDWTKDENHLPKWLIIIIVLAAAPELFFFGLVYSPTWVAMCFILGAHLILRRASLNSNWLDFTDPKQVAYIALSLLLFGFGVAFRWNTLAYAGVIIVDMITRQPSASNLPFGSIKKRINLGILWGALALVISVTMIVISGYGYQDFINKISTIRFVTNQAGSLSPDASTSLKDILLQTLLSLSPMFTPGFALLTLLGFIGYIRRRDPLTLVILAGFVGALPWLKSGVPKFLITSLPVLILCFTHGLIMLWNLVGKGRLRMAANLALALLLLAPWVIGIRVARGNTAWGPGFELRPYDYPETSGMQFNLTLGPGAAYPTPEGPRSLFGYGYVLIGGDWRKFVLERANERHMALQTAVSSASPLVVTSWSSDYFLDELYSMGFETSDPSVQDDQYFIKRYFVNSQGKSITLFIHSAEESTADELVLHLSDPAINSNKIILVGYPRVLHYLFGHFPEAMESLGTTSAAFYLDRLH